MNPRARAVADFVNGIKNNEVSFNNMQAETPQDYKTLRVILAYYSLWVLLMAYWAFFSNATCVGMN